MSSQRTLSLLPTPQLQATYLFLAGTQPFSFSTHAAAPPRKGVQGPREHLATMEDREGRRGRQLPSALHKWKLRHQRI